MTHVCTTCRRPVPLTADELGLMEQAIVAPLMRCTLTEGDLRVAEELVRLGYLEKNTAERRRNARWFRLTDHGHARLQQETMLSAA